MEKTDDNNYMFYESDELLMDEILVETKYAIPIEDDDDDIIEVPVEEPILNKRKYEQSKYEQSKYEDQNERKRMKRQFNKKRIDNLGLNLIESSNKDSLNLCSEISNDPKLVTLRVDNLILQHEIDELENGMTIGSYNTNYQSERLTLDKLKNNEELLNEYTGIGSISLFHLILDILCKKDPIGLQKWSITNSVSNSIRHEEQLLMAFMRLKCNFGFTDLAYRFRCSSAIIKSTIIQWIKYLHQLFFEHLIKDQQFPCYANDPSKLPEEFEIFSNCRIIIGVMNIEAEVSHKNVSQDLKKKQLRGIIGVSPLNEIIFVSDLYPENVTLKEIVQFSGLFDKLSPGDLILSQEPLDLEFILPPHVEFNNPLFLDSSQYISSTMVLSKIFVACKGITNILRKLNSYAVLDRIILSNRNLASTFFQVCSGLVQLDFDTESKLMANLHSLYYEESK